MKPITISFLPIHKDLETKAVLRKTVSAHQALAELKGVIISLPNEYIMLQTLALREARESSAIENIISTFDEIYRSNLQTQTFASAAAKEVHHYAKALIEGFGLVKTHGLLTLNTILQIQEVVEQNNAGFRKLPGTKLLNDLTGEIIYTPPQDYDTIVSLMNNLELFMNDDSMMDIDPLLKMAIIHYQFESIHPFYDGNGRTGRIINILYLVQKGLLGLPILSLSRFIIDHKNDYYRMLQQIRFTGDWEEWLLFMLEGIEKTAKEGISLIQALKILMQEQKNQIRQTFPKMYSQDLLNSLFKYPYTKIEYVQQDLGVSRNTAIRYLDDLVKANVLVKHKLGRANYYENRRLFSLLSGQ